MTLVDTWASTAAGAFALSENNLYTVEAFEEYFDHLKPDGMIAITRWEFRQPREALRVVSVAMEALHRLGVANPARNFIVAAQGPLNEDGIPVVGAGQEDQLHCPGRSCGRRALGQTIRALHLLYSPSTLGNNPFSDLMASNDPTGFARAYAYNVSPVTDNAPFFFFTLKPDQILSDLGLRHGIDWKVNLGVLVLLLVLVISAGRGVALSDSAPAAETRARAVTLRLPCFILWRSGSATFWWRSLSFSASCCFWAIPRTRLTVVIFLLMLSSGAGSLFSRLWLPRAEMGWLPLLLVIAALLADVVFLPSRLAALVGLGLRLSPAHQRDPPGSAGICDGHAFSHRTTRAGRCGNVENLPTGTPDNAVEWAWAMNAAASVLGSVLAMVIAIQFGLTVTLACGAVAYLSGARA